MCSKEGGVIRATMAETVSSGMYEEAAVLTLMKRPDRTSLFTLMFTSSDMGSVSRR